MIYNIQVLDETMSRDRDADRRRQFWYTGRRRMEYPNGDVYDGNWSGGKYDGKGIFLSQSGYRYEGIWRGGKRHGAGRETLPDGMVYDGEFVDNARHGRGVLKWPKGVGGGGEGEYIGEFQEGKRGGRGRQVWRDGDGKLYVYEGDWEDDLMHGQGTIWEDGRPRKVEARRGAVLLSAPLSKITVNLDLPDGSSYRGEAFSRSKDEESVEEGWVLDGYGVREWPSGERYEGEYRNSLRHGRGRFAWPDGSCYDGSWRNGAPSLDGILVENGQASVVWHDAAYDGNEIYATRRLQAPAVRVPLVWPDQRAMQLNPGVGFASRQTKKGSTGRSYSQNMQGDGSLETLPPLQPVRSGPLSVLSGYRDGTMLGEAYVRAARELYLPLVNTASDKMQAPKRRFEGQAAASDLSVRERC